MALDYRVARKLMQQFHPLGCLLAASEANQNVADLQQLKSQHGKRRQLPFSICIHEYHLSMCCSSLAPFIWHIILSTPPCLLLSTSQIRLSELQRINTALINACSLSVNT